MRSYIGIGDRRAFVGVLCCGRELDSSRPPDREQAPKTCAHLQILLDSELQRRQPLLHPRPHLRGHPPPRPRPRSRRLRRPAAGPHVFGVQVVVVLAPDHHRQRVDHPRLGRLGRRQDRGALGPGRPRGAAAGDRLCDRGPQRARRAAYRGGVDEGVRRGRRRVVDHRGLDDQGVDAVRPRPRVLFLLEAGQGARAVERALQSGEGGRRRGAGAAREDSVGVEKRREGAHEGACGRVLLHGGVVGAMRSPKRAPCAAMGVA